MANTLAHAIDQGDIASWRGFAPGDWRTRINVREFIQRNYGPCEGDGSFLQGPTERSRHFRPRCPLQDGGYRLEKLLPIDPFLWSPHVELIALFARAPLRSGKNADKH